MTDPMMTGTSPYPVNSRVLLNVPAPAKAIERSVKMPLTATHQITIKTKNAEMAPKSPSIDANPSPAAAIYRPLYIPDNR